MADQGNLTVKFGGVTYEAADIAKKNVVTKSKTNSQGIFEEYKEYTVQLKNGTSVSYKQQSEEMKATIDAKGDTTDFFGLKGATIKKGFPYSQDVYRLHGCNGTKVMIRDGAKNPSEKNKDKVFFYNRNLDGNVVNSENNYVNFNKGDRINGSYQSRNGDRYL